MKVTLTRVTENPVGAIEEAACNCYDSEPTGGKIMKSCYKSGHHSVLEFADFTFHIEGVSRACYDKYTEVLTKKGWKYFDDLTKEDQILTRKQNGQVEFHKPTDYIEYQYDGDLYYYSSQNIDLAITPNHNLYIKKYDVRVPVEYQLVPAEEATLKRYYMTKTIDYNNKLSETITIPGFEYERKNNCGKHYTKVVKDLELNRKSFYKLLAWYIAEGSVYYREEENSYCISISQKKEKNIQHILDICQENNLTASYDGNAIRFKNQCLGKYLKTLGYSHEKYIPFNIFDNFDKETAKLFIDEYIKGDGTIDKNGCAKIFTISERLMNQLYTLCYVAGYTCSYHIDDRVGQSHIWNEQKIINNYPCYVINISMSGQRNHEVVVKRDKHLSLNHYNDKVYCVSVPNHTLFVRRNGKAVWCGNCTHQLVRHRLASYAQRSQRYTKEDGFGYVVPNSIKNNPNALEMYENIMGSLAEGYHALNSNLGIPAEDARMVLPNACETVIEVKMNFRTLIHFMNERLCTRAQLEIRQMALLMKKTIEEQYPELAKYLVPKCEIHEGMPFCTEHSTCGRHPKLKVIYDDYTKLQDLIDESKNGNITDIDLAQKFWDIFCKEE